MSCPNCGGDGSKYVSQCAEHQALTRAKDARAMGIPDLVLAHADPLLAEKIRTCLFDAVGGYVLVKVTRDTKL